VTPDRKLLQGRWSLLKGAWRETDGVTTENWPTITCVLVCLFEGAVNSIMMFACLCMFLGSLGESNNRLMLGSTSTYIHPEDGPTTPEAKIGNS